MKLHHCLATICCGTVLVLGTFGCAGASIRADVAYAVAHDIQRKVTLTQADLATCMNDTTKCQQVSQDLKDILEASNAMEAAAVDAGATGAAVSLPSLPKPAPHRCDAKSSNFTPGT